MFKGITFSGHFFEMIIHQLAAGGAAALLADGVNQSQMEELLTASPGIWCQSLAAADRSATSRIPATGNGSGHERCHSDEQILSSRTW